MLLCALVVDSVTGVSTTIDLGEVGMPRCRRVAYPSQHQCRAQYMIFDGFMILKTICIYFKCVPICIIEGALIISGVTLARQCHRMFRPVRVVLKESYYP